MKSWNALSGLAAAALLVGSVGAVSAGTTPSALSDREALSDEGPSLEGTVAAVDYQSGQLILRTDDGLVNLTAAPEDIEDVNVGDVIRVALADDLSD
jgi:hypothetical protein